MKKNILITILFLGATTPIYAPLEVQAKTDGINKSGNEENSKASSQSWFSSIGSIGSSSINALKSFLQKSTTSSAEKSPADRLQAEKISKKIDALNPKEQAEIAQKAPQTLEQLKKDIEQITIQHPIDNTPIQANSLDLSSLSTETQTAPADIVIEKPTVTMNKSLDMIANQKIVTKQSEKPNQLITTYDDGTHLITYKNPRQFNDPGLIILKEEVYPATATTLLDGSRKAPGLERIAYAQDGTIHKEYSNNRRVVIYPKDRLDGRKVAHDKNGSTKITFTDGTQQITGRRRQVSPKDTAILDKNLKTMQKMKIEPISKVGPEIEFSN